MSDRDLRKTDGTLGTTKLSLTNQQNLDLIGENQFENPNAMIDTDMRENFTNLGDQCGGGEIESDRKELKPQTEESFLSQVLQVMKSPMFKTPEREDLKI